MRLSPLFIQSIVCAAKEFFGDSCRVILFGSRVIDEAKGGDIDLLIETKLDISLAVRARWRFLARLCMEHGERSIDVVITQNAKSDSRMVVHQALAFGVEL